VSVTCWPTLVELGIALKKAPRGLESRSRIAAGVASCGQAYGLTCGFDGAGEYS
jgi:hypothetical protein